MDDDEDDVSMTNAQSETTDESAGETTGDPDPSTTGGPSTSDATTGSTTSGGTDDETTGGAEESSSGGETGAALYAVSGSVTRSTMLAKDGDGIGTLVVGALEACDLAAPVILGAAIVPNTDLSEDGASAPFAIEPLGSGTVFLAAFLDDDGNLDPKNPLPDEGDPVLAEIAGDGILTCVEVEIDDADVTDVEIDLNELAMPVN